MRHIARTTVLLVATATHALPVLADPARPAALRTGAQVYDQICSACHATGVAHAPRFKDAAAWAPLIAEGQAVLTGHAWVGVRAMPARGGSPELSLEEFSRAVAWMARGAGGTWQDPDAAMMNRIIREAGKRLDGAIRDAQTMKRELQKQVRR